MLQVASAHDHGKYQEQMKVYIATLETSHSSGKQPTYLPQYDVLLQGR